jgi:CheY-like chemotaxis protein
MDEMNNQEQSQGRDRILVIDDSPIIRDMLVEILTDAGYRVDTAKDGVEGCAMARAGEYTVILCDVHMPRKNGLETVREILQSRPKSKIIMTDSFPDKLAQSARSQGALCCLQKPFDVKELRELIARVKKEGASAFGR